MPGPGTLLDRPVYPLSHRPTASSGAFTVSSTEWDYAIAGQPFLSAAGKAGGRTLARGFAAIRKDQFDNSAEPGEQGLADWWYRSQSSWHGGAGITYLEPAQDAGLRFRFASSVGIDVWTPGQLSLLKDVSTLKATANSVLVRGVIDGGVDKVLHADGTVLRKLTDGGETTITWGGAGTIRALVDNGTSYFAADTTAIYSGLIASGSGSALWNVTSAAIALGWVKQRLVLGLGPSLYELVGGSPPTLPTPKFTHPNSSWTWSAIAEGPNAIYAAGSAGSSSAIYELVLDTDGTVPTVVVGAPAQLPEGEVVYSLFGYLGALAIGTNKGIRIATTVDGRISAGPLLFEATEPVRAFTGKGQFVFAGATAGIDGSSGLVRIDLGTQHEDGRFAYATDLRSTASGVVGSICLYGASDRLVFGVNGTGVLIEHATQLTASGRLDTGRVRFNTLEPKLFRFVSLRGSDEGIQGTLALSLLDQGGGVSSIVSYTSAFPPGDEVALNLIQGVREYVALRFSLTRSGTNATQGPTMIGWQLKALPWTKRVLVLQVPLLCYDRERDKNSVEHGFEGRALMRLTALEELISSGDSTLFQDLTSGDTFVAIVESYEMDQVKPPIGASGWGGIITLQVRSVS